MRRRFWRARCQRDFHRPRFPPRSRSRFPGATSLRTPPESRPRAEGAVRAESPASRHRRDPALRYRRGGRDPIRLPWSQAGFRSPPHADVRGASALEPGFARLPEGTPVSGPRPGSWPRFCARRSRSSPAQYPQQWSSTRSSGTQSDTRYPCAGGIRPELRIGHLNTSFPQASKRIRCARWISLSGKSLGGSRLGARPLPAVAAQNRRLTFSAAHRAATRGSGCDCRIPPLAYARGSEWFSKP